MLNPQYLELVKAQLTQFATQADFESVLTTAFGTKIDRTKIFQLRQQWLRNDFSIIPPIDILSNGELSNSNGGYAASEDKIFVSSDFLARSQGNSNAITGLLLEEIGHKIDRYFNGDTDSAGDEGEIFSRLVSGQILSPAILAQLKAEDDRSVITVGGKSITIENQTFSGDANDNTINGTPGNDIIQPGTGKDTIDGGLGNDILSIYNANDTLNTTISYSNVNSGSIIGGSNAGTTFKNIEQVDFITGLGNDSIDICATTIGSTIAAGAGNDTITGGAGNDSINAGTGNDKIDGGAGNDLFLLFNFTDTANTQISYRNVNSGSIIGGSNAGTTFKNIEQVGFITGSGNDSIDISAATIGSFIQAGAGDDTIVGSAKGDNINAGTGTDNVDGGAGNDFLGIYNSSDTANTKISYRNVNSGSITGGSNTGTTFKNIEQVVFITGSGNDSIDISSTTIGSSIDAGAGNDRIFAGTGKDTIDGGADNDLFLLLNPTDIVNTTISYSNVNSGSIIGGSNNGTTFKNIEQVDFETGSGNDSINISATTTDSLIIAGAGNDTITGGAGNDTIGAGTGKDIIDGGTGDDLLVIYNITDTVNTTISYGNVNNGTVTGGSNAGTTFKNIEQVYFVTGSGNDSINISAAKIGSFIQAGAGEDIIIGGVGNDSIDAGAGNDSIFSNGKDIIDGGTGDDLLVIRNGTDTVNTTISYSNVNIGSILGGSNNGTTLKNIEQVYFGTGSGNDSINISAATIGSFIFSGAGNDYITGGAGNDYIDAGAGNDTIYAGTGKDYIEGGANDIANNILLINNGTDTVNTTISYNNVNSGSITGGSNAGTTFKHIQQVDFTTGSGNDVIDISAATIGSTIDAGKGNDTIIGGTGNDRLISGQGKDTIDGGAGNDYLNIYNFTDTVNTQILYTSVSGGTVTGGSNNGTTFKNIEQADFTTGAGNDVINISAATIDSYIYAGAGNDKITGGTGNDYIYAGKGNDTIDGGAGNDALNIYNYTDTVNSQILYTSVSGGTITGGLNNGTTFKNIEQVDFRTNSGNDVINISAATIGSYIYAGEGDDKITGGTGNDRILGSIGNDTLAGGAGNDELDGGSGNDFASYYSSTTAVTVNLATNTNNQGDTLISIEHLQGSATANSTLTGDINNNYLYSYGGNDILTGGAGNDILSAGAGTDTLNGNAGNDYLYAGIGNDTLNGGADSDVYVIDADVDTGTDTINEVAVTGGTDTLDFRATTSKAIKVDLSKTANQTVATGVTAATNVNLVIPVVSIENVYGGALGDTLTGNSLSNFIWGGAGNDTLVGAGGNDNFYFRSAALTGTATVASLLGKDTISDFGKVAGNQDKIYLSKTTFTKITTAVGALTAADFVSFGNDALALASTSTAKIFYSTGTGNLFYNQDGTAGSYGTNGGNFATLTTKPALAATDFYVGG